MPRYQNIADRRMSWRTARGTTFGLLILYPYLPLCHSVYSQSFPRKMAFMENKQINKSFCEIGFWFPVSCSFPSLLTVTHLATVKHMLQKRLGSCGQNFPPFNLNPRSSQGHFSWPHSPWIRVESAGASPIWRLSESRLMRFSWALVMPHPFPFCGLLCAGAVPDVPLNLFLPNVDPLSTLSEMTSFLNLPLWFWS